jgi:alcohol dehydrogenase
MLQLVAEGRIVPVIDRVWPLERTREAEEALERREVIGKIIIAP